MSRRATIRHHRVLSAAVAMLVAVGCTEPVKVENAAPRVTAITAASPVDGGLLVLYWLHDHEGDPCDLIAAYTTGSDCAALRDHLAEPANRPPEVGAFGLTAMAPGPLGHHTAGVASGKEAPGAARIFHWDTADVAAAEVCVYLLPDDWEGAAGQPAVSPTFARDTGFGDPAPWPAAAPATDAGPSPSADTVD